MVGIQDLTKVSPQEWLIPRKLRKGMRVDVRMFATQDMLASGLQDRSIEQAMNAASLPGLVGEVVVMPDMHQGYGFPIGGVAATLLPDGVISPGGIGYDINCGVRLLVSTIEYESVKELIPSLNQWLYAECPSGVGGKGARALNSLELEKVCREGSRWAYKNGFATPEDIEFTEDEGCLEGADFSKVSKRARERGLLQVGSLGSGNHFIEVDVVDQLFDPSSAQRMGLREGCLCLMVHSGSRGLGHQICTDYVHDFQRVIQKYGIHLPDRELVCAPLSSPEGQAYLGAMRCAANYAFCNRQVLAHTARGIFESVFAGKVPDHGLHLLYDLAHNIGKIENHLIDDKRLKVCVHRKGATRAFAPGMNEVPQRFRGIGQPVLIPGSMGTSSWVMVGTDLAMQKSLGSCAHGAGRVFSRSQAKRKVRGDQLKDQLKGRGIHVMAGSMSGLAEEAPEAYKDVDQVVDIVSKIGIARLRPVAVIKG
jgi:tRNA-splicing ligase RtcB